MSDPVPTMPRPVAVRWVIYISIVGTVLSMGSAISFLVHAPPQASRLVLGVGVGLSLALQVVLLWFLAAGYQWARILAFVGTGLALFRALSGPPATVTHPLAIAIYWIQLALIGVTAALLLHPTSAAWFRQRSQRARA
jgi:hypothetical protein